MVHLGVIKSGTLLPLCLQGPSRRRITLSTATKNLRVDGRRYAMGAIEVSTSCLVPNSFSRRYCSSAKTLSYSSNNNNKDDQDFVDALSSLNCIGSSHGWLGYIDPNNLSFYLFKPSLLNDPSYRPFISLRPPSFLSDNPNVVSKMVFSSSPSPIHRRHVCDYGGDDAHDDDNNNSSVLVVITLDWGLDQLGPAAAFHKIGDPSWTTLDNFPVMSSCSSYSFQDIAYYSKHKLFYVITNTGDIYSWDLSNYRYKVMEKQLDCDFQYLIKPPVTKFPRKLLEHAKGVLHCKHYLIIDESTGTLMMIRLQIYYDDFKRNQIKNKSYNHDVHRLDFNKLEWFQVKTLVDTALLIGRNNGSVVDVRKAPGMILPGYIYLACTADNFFQLTALHMNGVKFGFRNFVILRAEMTKEDNITSITSYPVWNFG